MAQNSYVGMTYTNWSDKLTIQNIEVRFAICSKHQFFHPLFFTIPFQLPAATFECLRPLLYTVVTKYLSTRIEHRVDEYSRTRSRETKVRRDIPGRVVGKEAHIYCALWYYPTRCTDDTVNNTDINITYINRVN